MAAIRKETNEQYRVSFGELAKVRRGEPVLVDPYLIARAVAGVMRECTVRAASGRPLLWNDYRIILARADFDLVRALQGHLERDLASVLAEEAKARQADLVGALRITVVFDEADELPAGQGVIRVGFVPDERQSAPRANEMTMRFDSFAIAGEIAARIKPSADTQFVNDTERTGAPADVIVAWPGGQHLLAVGSRTTLGRPHPEMPPGFVPLVGAGAKVNKQQFWLEIGAATVRVGRLPSANPVHVAGQALGAGEEIETTLPCEVSLSHGDVLVTLRRR